MLKKFNFIISLHPNLAFTHEIGHRPLTFLDTQTHLLSDLECVCIPKVFMKITNTNVFFSYYAICPWILKICFINCFLN